MRKGRKREETNEKKEADQSVVPAVKERERELARMLEQTREGCEADVKAAEEEAERRVQASHERVAASAAQRRQEAAAAIEDEVAGLRRELEEELQELTRTGERNLERAAAAIVTAVWPEESE